MCDCRTKKDGKQRDDFYLVGTRYIDYCRLIDDFKVPISNAYIDFMYVLRIV